YIYMLADYGSAGQMFPSGVPTLTNAGSIYLENSDGYSGDVSLVENTTPRGNTISSLTNSGTLVVHARNSAFVIADQDIYAETRTSVNNSGQIFCISDYYNAVGVLTAKANSTVTNSGLIA